MSATPKQFVMVYPIKSERNFSEMVILPIWFL